MAAQILLSISFDADEDKIAAILDADSDDPTTGLFD
jgi:hypothetical protein